MDDCVLLPTATELVEMLRDGYDEEHGIECFPDSSSSDACRETSRRRHRSVACRERKVESRTGCCNKGEDYKENWELLKKYLEDDAKYYKDGVMCSFAESVWGEKVCKDILTKMSALENIAKLKEEE